VYSTFILAQFDFIQQQTNNMMANTASDVNKARTLKAKATKFGLKAKAKAKETSLNTALYMNNRRHL